MMKLNLRPKLVEKLVWVPVILSKDMMKLNLRPKLVEKLVWVPVILFYKTFIPSYRFDALLC